MLRTRIRAGAQAGLVLSAVFAALFLAIATVELYVPGLAPAYGQRAPVTLRAPLVPRVWETPGKLREPVFDEARVLVARGEKLSVLSERHRTAMAYERTRRPFGFVRAASLYVIYFIVCMMLTEYLRRLGQSRTRLLRPQVGLFCLTAASIAVAKAMLLFTSLPAFWMPMAALSLWVALAFDRRTAFLLEVAVSFVAASLLRFDIVLLVVLLVRGVASTLFFFNRKHPSQMLLAGSLSGLAGGVAYVALVYVFQGRFDFVGDALKGLSSDVLGCVGGGVLAGLVARGLREPAERAMGHVSRDKLLDLTDLEQPLLKKMATEAPGSWEHARAMANLAEAASAAIGADALLTRVGAYYHDLGKTIQPKYFVENLAPGERTPHADLDPDVSADAIMAHVVMGTKILREGRIPEPVVEFAYTHHGTQLVEYFWNLCKEQGNPKGLTEEHFRYPGMKPQTKETAILMLVDSIEAASRTISPPEQKKFEEMIQRIIFTKLTAGQLDESGLTVEDLRVLIQRMAMALVNMYHGRVKYPWQREAEAKAKAEAAKDAPASAAPPAKPEPAAGSEKSAAPPAKPEPAAGSEKPAAPEPLSASVSVPPPRPPLSSTPSITIAEELGSIPPLSPEPVDGEPKPRRDPSAPTITVRGDEPPKR